MDARIQRIEVGKAEYTAFLGGIQPQKPQQKALEQYESLSPTGWRARAGQVACLPTGAAPAERRGEPSGRPGCVDSAEPLQTMCVPFEATPFLLLLKDTPKKLTNLEGGASPTPNGDHWQRPRFMISHVSCLL